MRQTDQVGIRLAATTAGQFTQAEQRAADAANAEAQAIARAAIAAGESSRAHQILTTALGNSAAASDRSVASLTTQINRLQTGGGLAEEFGSAVSSGILSIVGPAAIAGAALGALSQTGALIQLGAQAEQTAGAFDRLAVSAGTTGDALLSALRSASAGTISDLNLQLAANRAQLLGVADSAEEFSTLMLIARDRAQQMGISTTQAFNDLVTGLGRGSALILDNLGITLSVTEANKAYAESIGKTVAQLSEEEKKQALINAVLAQGRESLQRTGGAVESNAAKLERLGALGENIKAGLGGALADAILPTADAVGSLAGAFDGSREGLLRYADAVAVWSGQNAQGVANNHALVETLLEVTNIGSAAASSAQQAAAQQAVAMIQEANAAVFAANAEAEHAAVVNHLASEHAAGGEAVRLFATEVQQSGAQSQIDAANKETQAAQTALAAAQANAAASAFLALNPQISTSGVASLAAAGQIDPLIAQLVQARIQALQAANALATFNAQAGARGQSVVSRGAADELKNEQLAERAQSNRTAAATRYNAQLDAQRDRINAIGSAQQRVQQAETDLASARTRYGENSAQAYRAETALLQAQERAKREASRGGGAARLSDQQQLHNSLLNDQEKYQDQSEQAERQHQQRVLDIEREYQKRQLEQQRANEISKRQSRADFYDSLTQATKDIGPKEAQALSAAYEEAYAKAQQLAQAGQSKLAADYLAFKQKEIQQEAEYQKRLAEARKNKDQPEVERLQAIHKLQQDAAAEEERQLLEGGDANQKARDEQLADEQAKYEEQQGKLGTAAENAAERKVNAAVRAGKAVDDENAKLREQEQILGRIGPRAPGGGTAPVSTTPEGGAAGTGTPAGALDIGAIAAALQAITDAVYTIGGNITSAQNQTTGAVRGLGGRAVGA